MSTAAGTPSNGKNTGVTSPDSKGKGKEKGASRNQPMEEEDNSDAEENDDDDDEDGSDHMEEDDDSEEEEEGEQEIDPSAILGRRTRGVKVDYTSKEALEKAGLTGNEKDDEDEEMKE